MEYLLAGNTWLFYRITGGLGLIGKCGNHPDQPPSLKAKSSSGLLRTECTQVLNDSEEGDSTTSLINPFQCLITPTAEFFFNVTIFRG